MFLILNKYIWFERLERLNRTVVSNIRNFQINVDGKDFDNQSITRPNVERNYEFHVFQRFDIDM